MGRSISKIHRKKTFRTALKNLPLAKWWEMGRKEGKRGEESQQVMGGQPWNSLAYQWCSVSQNPRSIPPVGSGILDESKPIREIPILSLPKGVCLILTLWLVGLPLSPFWYLHLTFLLPSDNNRVLANELGGGPWGCFLALNKETLNF